MIYVGIDYSINSPAITIIDKDHEPQFFFKYDIPKRKKVFLPNNFNPSPTIDSNLEYMDRYIKNAEWVLANLSSYSKEEIKIVLEGFSYSSVGNRLFNIAENAGILKYMLHINGYTFALVPPSAIKKYFTKKGNSSKGYMVDKFQTYTNLNLFDIFSCEKIDSPLSDIADSYAMAMYCKEIL